MLSTDSIISGMKKALAAGNSISSLTSNPNFASLSEDKKREVLSGLRGELINSPSSKKSELIKALKGTLGGAVAGVPLGALLPVGITISQEGLTRGGLKGAALMLKNNKTLRGLAGASMALGALGGLANSAFSSWTNKKNYQALLQGLDEVNTDEGLASALYGGIRQKGTKSIALNPILEHLNKITSPYASATILSGYHDGSAPNVDLDAERIAKIKDRLIRDYPIDPERMDSLVQRSSQNMSHRAELHNIVSNQSHLIGLDPSVTQEIANDIATNHGREGDNINSLNQLAQAARLIRNQKRGI